MQALISIQAYRNREDWGGEWGAAFHIFGKFDFLRTDTNNGRVENYKFVESSQKFITFCNIAIFMLYVLYCTFFYLFLRYFFIYLNLLQWSCMEVNILITVKFLGIKEVKN